MFNPRIRDDVTNAPPPPAALGPAQPAYNASLGGAPDNGQFYDQAALTAYLQNVKPGADGRKILGDADWMKLLQPISGLTKFSDAYGPTIGYATENGSMSGEGPGAQAVYKDKLGRTYRDDGAGNLTYFDNNGGGWQNPTGSKHDRIAPTYKLGDNGIATPESANTGYQPSTWVDSGRPAAIMLGSVLAAGFGGAALAGAGEAGGAAAAGSGAAAGGGGAMSSADLAALYGSEGYGASTAAEAGYAGLGAQTAGGAAGLSGSQLAALPGAYASAPAYSGVGSAGAGAAGEGAAGSSTLGQTLKDMYSYYKDAKTVGGMVNGGGQQGGTPGAAAGGGGLSAGDRYRQQLAAQALRDQASQQAPQAMPGYVPGS